jgi:hypothetical protein
MPQTAHNGSDATLILSFSRVRLVNKPIRTPSFVLVKLLRNPASFEQGRFIQIVFQFNYTYHQRFWTGPTRFQPVKVVLRSQPRQAISLLIPDYTTMTGT